VGIFEDMAVQLKQCNKQKRSGRSEYNIIFHRTSFAGMKMNEII